MPKNYCRIKSRQGKQWKVSFNGFDVNTQKPGCLHKEFVETEEEAIACVNRLRPQFQEYFEAVKEEKRQHIIRMKEKRKLFKPKTEKPLELKIIYGKE